VLAHLLSYPDAELRAHLPELQAALHEERALSPARLAELDALITRLARRPLDTEAEYVELFDRGRGTALHLFEHVHGDSRDRGPAMVDLCQDLRSGRPLPGAGRTARPPDGGAGVRVDPAAGGRPGPSWRDRAHPAGDLQRAAASARAATPACWPRCWTWPARRRRPSSAARACAGRDLGRAHGLRRLFHPGPGAARASRNPSRSCARRVSGTAPPPNPPGAST
jgi:hypothetical protein